MSDRERVQINTRWWSSVPSTGDAKVVRMPRPTLDDLERDIAQAQNAVIDCQAAVDRAIIAHDAAVKTLEEARGRIAERLKESGARVEFTQHFQTINQSGTK